LKHLLLLLALAFSIAAQTNTSSSPLDRAPNEPPPQSCVDGSQRTMTIVGNAIAAAGIDADSLDSHFVLTVSDTNGNARSVDIRQLKKNLRIGSGNATLVANGHGSSIQNGLKKRRLPPWIAESEKPEHFPATYVASAIADPTCRVQLLGEEDLASGRAQHIRIWTEPNDGTEPLVSKLLTEAEFWVDSNSQQIVRARTYIFSPEIINNRSTVDVYYSDFRTVGSRQIAFKMTRLIEGTKTQEMVVNSAEFGVGNKEADFADADGDAQ
jgi:hypothetical protein